jgi:hypothetical protein
MTLKMVLEVLEELWRSRTVHVVIDAKKNIMTILRASW